MGPRCKNRAFFGPTSSFSSYLLGRMSRNLCSGRQGARKRQKEDFYSFGFISLLRAVQQAQSQRYCATIISSFHSQLGQCGCRRQNLSYLWRIQYSSRCLIKRLFRKSLASSSIGFLRRFKIRSMSSSRGYSKKPCKFFSNSDQSFNLNDKSSYLQSLKNIVRCDQQAALAVSTRKKYMCAWRSFLVFCQLFDLPFNPVSEILCFYISISSRSISPRSIEVYLSGISYMFRSKCPEIKCETSHPSV